MVMADQRVLDPPGWDRVVMAGRVDPPDPAVVELVRQRVLRAAREEQVRSVLPIAVPLVRRRRQRRRLAIITGLAAAAAAVVAVGVWSGDERAPVAVLASGGGAPALVPPEYDADTCAIGEGRNGLPATDVATLGYLPTDPGYRLEHLFVREYRMNCPTYAPSLALTETADDGRLLRYVTVYGPLAVPPWQRNDDVDRGVVTSVPITETDVRGSRAQLVDHTSPSSGTSIQAVWTDAAGFGWTADTGGLTAAELSPLLDALTLGAEGARLGDADTGGMTMTAYESTPPERRWDPVWFQEYRDGAGTSITVDTRDRGHPAGSVPSGLAIRDRWEIEIRGGKTAHLYAADQDGVDGVIATGSLHWQEGAGTWVSVMISPYDRDKLLAFAESLAPAAPDDPRLDQAE